jgi:hypothetical protein
MRILLGFRFGFRLLGEFHGGQLNGVPIFGGSGGSAFGMWWLRRADLFCGMVTGKFYENEPGAGHGQPNRMCNW